MLFLHSSVSLENMLTVQFHLVSFVKLARHPCLTNFILITCPLLHTSVRLCTDGLWSLFYWDIVRVDFVHLMPWTGGLLLLALHSTRRRFVFRAIFFIYKQHLPSFFTISFLLILWRERTSPPFRQLYFRRFTWRCLLESSRKRSHR